MSIKRFPKAKNGSALLLTLLIVSLLLVIVLSFVVFVRMQLREVSNGHNLRVARQNAKLGLELAISELQKYAGADQRVTVPATTVYPEKDFDELYDGDADEGSSDMFSLYRSNATVSSQRSYLNQVATYTTPREREDWDGELADWWNGNGRNPHWLGVFNSARRVDRSTDPANPTELSAQYYELDPDTTYGEPQRNQLPVWLISGNEQLGFNPLTDASYPSNYRTPEQALGDPNVAGSEVVWMVGEGSASLQADSVDGLDGRVKAPRIETPQGHYAYWVSDESTKANFSVREPDEYADALEGTVEYRNRLQVPQRVGWERMTGFADVFDGGGMDVNDSKFAKVVSQSQIGLVNADFVEPVKANFHHVTSSSQSLLTDTALGGLKKDLTRYLEDGEGLVDDEPIADPSKYDNDPRFGAYGGENTGFPNASTAALDGIPTWEQLRSWYTNEASGSGSGSIDPDPESGATPVLSYVHLQNGMSYDGTSKMIRMHWAPMIAIWNPLDVGLNTGSYEIDMGVLLSIDNYLLVNAEMADSSRLADRAALDPEADWQLVTLVGPDFFGPGGKKVLRASSSGGTVTVTEVNTAGPHEIFKMELDNSTLTIPGGDTSDRYMVKLDDANPDSFNGDGGPWVYDGADNSNATSDAFGRIYYHTEAGHTISGVASGMYHSKVWAGSTLSNSSGLLKNKKAFARISVHDETNRPANEALPVDSQFKFRVSTSFEPGEVKIFTLGLTSQWIEGNRMTLVNSYDADRPTFFWRDMVEVTDGPASSETDGLRWTAYATLSSPGYVQLSPSVKMSVNGDTFFETSRFGDGGGWDMALGNDFYGFYPFSSGNDKDGNPVGLADADGDGNENRKEPMPKFINRWRPVYDFDNFYDHIQVQTGSLTDRSNWAFGDYYLTPFQMDSDLGRGNENSIYHFLPVFSRFNLGAKDFIEHPLTEQSRNLYGVNNDSVGGGVEGLERYVYQKGIGGKGVELTKWDSNQVDQSGAGTRGYTLTAVQDDGSYIVRGLTHVAIRNAKRADSEILSLGQLQQINLSKYFWQPSFPIGNGDATPHTDREAIAGIHSREMGADGGSSSFLAPGVRPNHARPTSGNMPFSNSLVYSSRNAVAKDGLLEFWGGWNMATMMQRLDLGGNTMLDLSYLLNENIWDRFFLSTMASTPGDLTDPLPNARLRFNDNAEGATDLLDYDLSSAYLTAVGSLNVNSTSVEAWKALLTSFRDLKLGSGGGQNPDNTVPVTRTLTPINDKITFDSSNVDDDEIGAVSTGKDLNLVLSGFRYLDDEMIQALSERIVDEVRMRGPFYSLSDFVNRRLAPPAGSADNGSSWHDARSIQGSNWIDADYDPFPGLQGLNGALQRAINLSGINGGVNHPDLGDSGAGAGNRYDMVYSLRIKNTTSNWTSSGIGGAANSSLGASGAGAGYKYITDPAHRSHLDTEHSAAAPAGEAGQLMQGAPGFVTQGDLLAMIAPALTARGDTFLIRAYGDSSAGGDADARAWLEAVVQRIPEPIKPAGNSGEDAWRPTDSFGRRFKVVSVRWLTPEEI